MAMALVPLINLPIRNPVGVFSIAIAIFFLVPLLLKPSRLPGIVGILLVGIVIGPHVLGIIPRGRTIRLLGQIGILYLLFVSGLEIDINKFLDNKTRVIAFALVTFLLPMILGTTSGIFILGFSLISAILFASMFSSHTILGYQALERLDILKNRAVTTTVSVALITDTTALLILAAVEQVQHGHATLMFWAQFILKLAIFFVGVLVIVPKIGRWFFSNIDNESYLDYLFTILVVYGAGYLATFAGADPIIGAFLAGITMNRLVPSTGTLINRIQFMGNALFIPFFFLSIGMLVQPRIFLQSLEPWITLGVMLGVMFAMKFVASVVTGQIYGFERYEWLTMFGISTGQGPAAIAIALVGSRTGLFSDTLVNAVVVMVMVSMVVSPYLTERFGRGIVEIEDDQEYEPRESPQRILIPLTEYTDNSESLLDLAMLLGEFDPEEPIHALTVVEREDQQLDVSDRYTGSNQSEADGGTDEGQTDESDEQQSEDEQQGDESDEEQSDQEQTEEEVAEAEETLEEAEEQATSAEVPINTLTRVVDSDIADGIAGAIEENRITTVIMGWSDQRRFGQRLFGDIIDQLLQRTNELVFVANLSEPVNTAERLVVVLPSRIAAHPGFFDGVNTVQIVAEQLGISIQYLVVDGDRDRYEGRISSVEPEASSDIDTVDSWSEFRSSADERFDEGDFVLALTPREGGRGWESALDDLPQQLASNAPENVGVLYLPEEGEARSRRFLDTS